MQKPKRALTDLRRLAKPLDRQVAEALGVSAAVPAAAAPAPDSNVEARRGLLEAQLWKEGHTIGEPTAEGQLARGARIAAIQAELRSLSPKPEPETGERAGIVQIGNFLGDRWAPSPREPNDGRDPDYDHPLIREYGARIK
jgi:hypothetical protein